MVGLIVSILIVLVGAPIVLSAFAARLAQRQPRFAAWIEPKIRRVSPRLAWLFNVDNPNPWDKRASR